MLIQIDLLRTVYAANKAAFFGFVTTSLTLLLLAGGCTNTTLEPSLAHGTDAKNDLYWAAFLVQKNTKNPQAKTLAVSGYNNNGMHIKGPVYPLGKNNQLAITRPAVAYSNASKVFLVATAEKAKSSSGKSYHRIASRFFDINGSLLKKVTYLFDDNSSVINLSSAGSLNTRPIAIAYNSILDEFIVTAQRTVFTPAAAVSSRNGVWAQRISLTKGVMGAPVEVANMGLANVVSHSIAYAPVKGTTPGGGRYLLSYGPVATLLLDSQAQLVSSVSLNLGTPKSAHYQPDVAFGTVAGKQTFLLVYGDGNNKFCKPGIVPCISWTGVWGAFIDPNKTNYASGALNNPFPISKIDSHVVNKYSTQTQVSYNPASQAFFVVWRELPDPKIKGDETRSHIRGNKVDYYVSDGDVMKSGLKEPYTNLVISPVSGSCAPSPVLKYCASIEDPMFPHVTSISGKKVAVYWQQTNTPKSNAVTMVRGKVLSIP